MNKYFLLYIITSLFFFQTQAEELRRAGFFTHAAALYWQAEESGLGYALKSPSSENLASNSSIKNPTFDWDFGFKFGLGYRIPHDCFEFELQFTSFQTHTDAVRKSQDGDLFFQ